MLLLLAALLLLASVALVGEVVTRPARERRAMLQRVAGTRVRATRADATDARERLVAPVAARLARLALRLSPSGSVESVRARLLAAGMRDVAAARFLALKGAAAVSGAVLGLLLGASAGAGTALVLAAALGGLGVVAPEFLLSVRARKRREEVQRQLPDALDLLAVSVEAGLALDAAMARLTEHMSGALVEELSATLSEMRIGRARRDALTRMAQRVDAPELTAFVRAVLQADQLGLSLSRILRVQAEESRRRRQAAAEEQAMKAPVKMLFPTVFFIFPAMFVVILGPALLNFGEIF